MWVKVTSDHIQAGMRRSAMFCPVAHALRECFPLSISMYISVGTYELRMGPRGEEKEIFTFSEEVRTKIHNFDAYGVMVPFEFDLAMK